jgi:hypothetical protein
MINTNCWTCRHYLGAWRCISFLDGIPFDIQSAKNDHREPYPGDQGIQFEAIQ